MLKVDALSAWYGAARILYDLSFDVGRGEVVALMGRNGAGKSTTMKAIMGLIAQRQGTVTFNGEQQMLTVARTLMGNPLLVLLDEPSEGVAPLIVEQMANTIIELKKEGLSILLSEQNIHFAQLVSDRVYVLEKGQIQWQGTMAQLSGSPDIQRTYLTV